MNEEMQAQATLFAKLARVMGTVRSLPKTGHNTHFNYKFVTDGAVSDAISAALAAENVAFIPSILESRTDGKITRTRFLMTFACGDTGAIFQSYWEGEGMDNQDKGVAKSATSAVKYFLLKTFLIDTGERADDPDNDAVHDKRGKSGGDKPATPKKPVTKTPVPTFDATTGATFQAWITSELALESGEDVLKAFTVAYGDPVSNILKMSEWPYGIPEAIGACIAYKCDYDAGRINAFIDNAKRAKTFKNSAKVPFTPDYLETYRELALKMAK